MNKKRMAIILAILAVLMLVCFIACRREETPNIPPENDLTAPPATIEATEYHEETIPGLEPFDGEVNIDESTEPTTGNEEEKSEPTVPATEKDEENSESAEPTDGKVEEVEPTVEPTTGENEDNDATTPPASGGNTSTAYEEFQAMSGSAQKEFMDSFGSVDAFYAWLNAARAEHEALNPDIEIGDGNIDLGG